MIYIYLIAGKAHIAEADVYKRQLYYLLTAGHINSAITAQKLQHVAAIAFTEAKTAQAASFDGRILLQIVVDKLQILVEPGTACLLYTSRCV